MNTDLKVVLSEGEMNLDIERKLNLRLVFWLFFWSKYSETYCKLASAGKYYIEEAETRREEG